MLDRTDSERPAQLRMDQCWRRGEIGDPTYLRSLVIYGYTPAEANTELSLLKLESRR
jgi:hypothetical protein